MQYAIDVLVRNATESDPNTGDVEVVFRISRNYSTVLTISREQANAMHASLGAFLAETPAPAPTSDAARALAGFVSGAEFEPYKSAISCHRVESAPGEDASLDGETLTYPDGSRLFVPTDGEARVLDV